MSDGQHLDLTLEVAVAAQRNTVWRLLQLYLHDFSGFAAAGDEFGVIGTDGTYSYAHFDDYWRGDPARRIYLLRVAGDLAGFVFVNDWPPSGVAVDRAVAEFFVMRKYRRNGIGRRAAQSLFRRHHGTWELGAMPYNAPSLAFWRRTLRAPCVKELSETRVDNERWKGTVFRFRSSEGAGDR